MWSEPLPLYAKLNPVCSQILHMHSIWNPFKIFTMSLSAEEFANETLKYSISIFGGCRSNRFRFPWLDNPRSPTISTSQYVGDTCHVESKGQGYICPKSSDCLVFTPAINTPLPLPSHFNSARTHLPHSSSDLAPLLTSSPSERKSFTALTSSLSYSHRPRKSALYRCCSCLPPPS